VLIDNGSSVDILYAPMYNLMQFAREKLQPVTSPLIDFVGDRTHLIGTIDVLVMFSFLVANYPSTYNAILGRTTLNKMKAVLSTYHLKMKFLTIITGSTPQSLKT
jgi:hypothetical protein